MFVVNKGKTSIVNMSQVTVIYLGADNCTVKADYQNGNGCQLGRYHSEAAAKTVIEIIASNMGKSEICFMPDDNFINAKINIGEQKPHHISGKKTKGHGGS